METEKLNIAIIGCTGLVGKKFIQILNENEQINADFYLYANQKDFNKKMKIYGKNYLIKILDDNIFLQNLDYAIFCCSEQISQIYLKKLSKCTICIDFSSYFRKNYPLIIPEINKEQIKGNIICNPNCSTAISLMAIYRIHKKFGLKQIIYSTYQAVSGAGCLALKDLKQKNYHKLKKLDYVIQNNLIPIIGELDKNGISTEENKMIFETKKILNDKNIKVSASCVRIPIKNCHGISIYFETEKNCKLAQIMECLQNSKGVKVYNDFNLYPMPILSNENNDVLVGRIRQDKFNKNCFSLFVVGDNLRKGASYNAFQILKELICLKKH